MRKSQKGGRDKGKRVETLSRHVMSKWHCPKWQSGVSTLKVDWTPCVFRLHDTTMHKSCTIHRVLCEKDMNKTE
jgi:hypothetical protein